MADVTPEEPAASAGRDDGASGGRRGLRGVSGGAAAVVAVAALLGGVVGGVVVAAVGSDDGDTAAGSVCDATAVAEQTLPSVVMIQARSRSGSGSGSGGASGTGSGVLIRAGGYVLTNDHVISVAADGGSVTVLYDDGTTSEATIAGRDPRTDLAVLEAEDGAGGRPVVALGSSADVVVGQPVVALGAPLGLSSTVTTGIVSALDRSLSVPKDGGQRAHLVEALQTDAAINPGNSGGPLVDCSSRLLGINTAIATVPNASGQAGGGNVGLGFAIPVDLADRLAGELIADGRVNHPSFGLEAREVVAADGTPGLFVARVVDGGPADEAGLRAGDIITAVDGASAVSVDQLTALTLTKGVGDEVEVAYERDGRSRTTTVTLARL